MAYFSAKWPTSTMNRISAEGQDVSAAGAVLLPPLVHALKATPTWRTRMLTWTERVMLYNQFRILELLDPARAEEYQQKQEIVGKGYQALYATLNENVSGEPPPKSVGEEVHEILELFRTLKLSAKKVGYADAKPQIKFQGFDGNNESDHYGYAVFLIEKQGLWPEHRAESYDAHAPMLPKYSRMIEAWKKHGRRPELGRDQLDEITDA